MKRLIALLTSVLLSFAAMSQTAEPDTSWKNGGFIGLNVTQVNLSQWVPGGESNFALASNFALFANYAKDKSIWDNRLELAYGIIKGETDRTARKSDDKMDLTSKYGYQIGDGKWYYSVLFNFKSQFTSGYYYPDDSTVISKFLAPGYFTLSPGVTYKPVDYFDVFLSPVGAKVTVVNDKLLSDAGAYGVDSGKTSRTEIGAYMNARIKKDIMKNVTLLSKLELFWNYADEEDPTNVDVNWEVNLLMKVNEFITATIATQLVYDADQIARTQFKESLGIGLGYKF